MLLSSLRRYLSLLPVSFWLSSLLLLLRLARWLLLNRWLSRLWCSCSPWPVGGCICRSVADGVYLHNFIIRRRTFGHHTEPGRVGMVHGRRAGCSPVSDSLCRELLFICHGINHPGRVCISRCLYRG